MSTFDDKYDLFMKPKTSQYGSHMVMSNVEKQHKMKYINIDTKFRDEYNEAQTSNQNSDFLANQSTSANYIITLPERVNDVKSIQITNIEIPHTFYNVSNDIGNNYFKIVDSVNNEKIITIPSENYTTGSLQTAINSAITTAGISNFTLSVNDNSRTTIVSGAATYTIDFAVNSTGISDKFRFKSKLGWLLGFRNISYGIDTITTITSEGFSNLNSNKYLYLAIEEFNRGNQSSFVSPLFTSLVNKNIISRITVDNQTYPFGSILPASHSNGLLISDNRCYTGKIDLQKLKVSILNEDGDPVVLNGLDFSFCIAVVHE
jgi:hypothetical protein